MSGDWRIGRQRGQCAACARTFEAGEGHYSSLSAGADGFARADHCTGCFDTSSAATAPVWWRTHHQEQARRLKLDLESLEALFFALEPRVEPEWIELRALLALLLLRKRRLKLERIARQGEQEWLVLRRPRRSEELLVRVVDLAPERQQALAQQLARVFEGEALSFVTADSGSPTPADPAAAD
jgi:hypothetical protein